MTITNFRTFSCSKLNWMIQCSLPFLSPTQLSSTKHTYLLSLSVYLLILGIKKYFSHIKCSCISLNQFHSLTTLYSFCILSSHSTVSFAVQVYFSSIIVLGICFLGSAFEAICKKSLLRLRPMSWSISPIHVFGNFKVPSFIFKLWVHSELISVFCSK